MEQPTSGDRRDGSGPDGPSTEKRREADRLKQAKASLCDVIIPQLSLCGVRTFEALYSNEGEAPAVYSMRFWDAANSLVKQRSLPDRFRNAVTTCLASLLPPKHFEENNGYRGVLTINAETSVATIEHEEQFTMTRDTTVEFTV